MTGIKKLVGREKIQWVVVSNKLNEIIDYLDQKELIEEQEKKEREEKESNGVSASPVV